MASTTTYGSWANHCGSGSFEAGVWDMLGDHVEDFDTEGLAAAYREAINASLEPAGISLAGSEFYGPHPKPDDSSAVIVEAIGAVDFWELAPKFCRAGT